MKIKKFLIIIAVLLSLTVSYYLVKNYNFNLVVRYHSYQDYVSIVENKAVVPLSIVTKDNFQADLFIEKLKESFDDRTFVITSVDKDEQDRNIYNTILYSNNEDLIKDLALRKAKELSFDNNDEGYYSSDFYDENATDYLEIIDNQLFDTYHEQVRIMTLNTGKEILADSNGFMLFFFDDDPVTLEKEFADFLETTGLRNQISFSNFYEGYSGVAINDLMMDGMRDIRIITLCVLIIYVLFFVILIYKKRKTILIQNIHGISLANILSKDLVKTLIFHFIIFVFGILAGTNLLTSGKVFDEKDLINQIIEIIKLVGFGYIFAILIIYFLLKTMLRINNIKKSEQSTKNLFIMLAVKIVFLIAVSTSFINITGQTVKQVKLYLFFNKYYDVLENLATVGVLYPSVSDSHTVFEYYFNHGGYYADFDTYETNTYEFLQETFGDDMDEEELQASALEYPVIYANTDYIDSFNRPIYKTDGTEIDLSKIDENIMLVPEKCRLDDFSKYSNGIDENIEVIKIKNPGAYIDYTFNTAYEVVLEDPIIYIITKSDLLSNQYLTVPLDKISREEITAQVLELTDKKAQIESNQNQLELEMYNIKNTLIDNGILFVLYLIIYISIIYQTLYLFIDEFKKLLIIEYLFGKTRLQRYGDIFVLNLLSYFIPLFCCIILRNNIADLLKLYSITYIGEILVMYLMIHKIERHNTSIILKGESGL